VRSIPAAVSGGRNLNKKYAKNTFDDKVIHAYASIKGRLAYEE
jgi:hypothetical protein